jgi:hypothetical protein
MIYLIFKMALYLLVALGSGAAAGWLMRNRSASEREDEWSRELDEHKSKLLQLESLMRSRDEQLQALRVEAKEKDTRIGGLRDEVGTASKALKSAEAPLEQTEDAQARAVEGGSSATVAELMAEVARLRSELSDARVRAAASELTREGGTSEQQLRVELEHRERELHKNGQEHDRMSKTLEQERRKVVELECERGLQSKSLRLLHQQLDMERERAVGGR